MIGRKGKYFLAKCYSLRDYRFRKVASYSFCISFEEVSRFDFTLLTNKNSSNCKKSWNIAYAMEERI